jgi:hypothetical protein
VTKKSILLAAAMLALTACAGQASSKPYAEQSAEIGRQFAGATAAQFGAAVCDANTRDYADSNVSCRSSSSGILIYYPYPIGRPWLDAHCQELLGTAQAIKSIDHYKVDMTSQISTTGCRF